MSPTPLPPSGGPQSGSDSDLSVEITTNIKWTFVNAIDQDDVISSNFIVYRKADNKIISGNLTIDGTKKIVIFVPSSIQASTTYVAEAKAVDLLDGSGGTTPLSIEFTTDVLPTS